MALSAIVARYYTPEEYLALEREATYRSEYIDGYIYAMSGGTPEHSLIKVDLGLVVRLQLRGGPCKTYDSDMQVRVDAGLYTYPDLTVACGDIAFDDHNNLLNPIAIFEVLSPSTEAYDRGEKFNRYQGIASLRQYVLVNQSTPRIEVFTREPGDVWTFSRASGLDASIRLESIGCELALRDVYDQAMDLTGGGAGAATE
jgi:Uma2 family endonuclease